MQHHLAGAVYILVALTGCSDDTTGQTADAAVDLGASDSVVSDDALADAAITPDVEGPSTIEEKVPIGMAVALPVSLGLLGHGNRQYVAYYNANRKLEVVSRILGTKTWARKVLNTTVPWDGHNNVVLAVDTNGELHVSGNMHGDGLRYWRTAKKEDVTTLTNIPKMIGTEENQVTYPAFIKGPNNELIFNYRLGTSGAGATYFNQYVAAKRSWKRLVSKPILYSPGTNAYPFGPIAHKGFYHYIWVWRDAANGKYNHDLSYARSADLINWTKSDGTPLTLPINVKNGEVVDPVPNSGGLVNYNNKLGFDSKGRPIISYVKFGPQGKTQLYNARLEQDKWKIYQTSQWKDRWDCCQPNEAPKIFINPVQIKPGIGLCLDFWHWKEGRHTWKLDEATLKPSATLLHPKDKLPAAILKVTSSYPGMRAATLFGLGDKPEHERYFLRWEVLTTETIPSPWPPTGEIAVYKLSTQP